MLFSVKGIFRAGKIELTEMPPAGVEGPVIVTFLSGSGVNLSDREIEPEPAKDLRHRLSTCPTSIP
jgi:hypothetical protein